jgi:hypothetical protein
MDVEMSCLRCPERTSVQAAQERKSRGRSHDRASIAALHVIEFEVSAYTISRKTP